MPGSQHSQRVTVLLVSIATALVQSALHSRQPGVGLVLMAVSIGGAIGIGFLARRRQWTDWTVSAVSAVLCVSLLPVPWDMVSRGLFRVGEPYEVQLAYILRNAMLALAATPRLPRATEQATLASFFLVVFGFLWSSGPLGIALLVAYSIVGTWWLLAAYWDRLGGRFADSSERALPVRPAMATVALLGVLALLVVPLASQSSVTTALAGFFPSSGGTQGNDPFAHGGVGDGDQMVAAKDQASSFGPIESELFLESEMPSLYDAFNEFSQSEPVKKKRLRRAIPLAPSQVQVNHQKRGLNQQAQREFSAVRRSSGRTPKTEDLLSASLLLVKGRTPQHLALDTFDRWDGHALIAAEQDEELSSRLLPADKDGRRWLDLTVSRPPKVFTATTTSQVRVVNLKTERVPTPPGVRRLTLDGLHSASMFNVSEGAIAMDVQHVPQLTIFNFVSQLRDRSVAPELYWGTPEEDLSATAELARKWTQGVPVGWSQVEAIVDRLRNDYEYDASALVPESADDAVEHFLTESKSGPDYLFAASAAVMLRSLGYETRVRSGFYARPDRYVSTAQATQVMAEDAHFWLEVLTSKGYRTKADGRLLKGVWVTLEPTPGFDVLYAPESLWARLSRGALALAKVAVAHPVAIGLSLIGVGLVYASRRRLLDGALLGWWSIRSRTSEVGRLTRLTLRLLEWRAWAYRQRRPTGVTLGRWETLRPHNDFVGLASWALYGMGSPAPLRAEDARTTCWQAIRTPLSTPDRFRPDGAHREQETKETH